LLGIYTFSGVLLEKDILTLPQLQSTFCSIPAKFFARSLPYGQFPRENIKDIQYDNLSNRRYIGNTRNSVKMGGVQLFKSNFAETN
jgi:hypothetical protein